uniref:Uncharacterized protein n=1 Tax=Wuchereria bancrofti TaxID=6293 RepID=A0AAF5Q7B1_WUCBA
MYLSFSVKIFASWLCYREDCPMIQRLQSKELEPTCGETYYYLGRCYEKWQVSLTGDGSEIKLGQFVFCNNRNPQ